MKKTEDKTKVWIFVLAAVAVLAVAAAVFVGIQKRSADEANRTGRTEKRRGFFLYLHTMERSMNTIQISERCYLWE